MYPKHCYINVSDDTEDKEVVLRDKSSSSILRYLSHHEVLDYGQSIALWMLEHIFEVKYTECDPQQWQFNLLAMKQILESEGFFTTTRGMKGSIRTLSREEMPFYNEKENKKALKQLKARQKGLYMIDPNDLDKEYAKKLEFEQLRNGSLIIDFHDQMKKRCT